MENVRVFPSASVSGGSMSVTSADCPALKANLDGFSKWKASMRLACELKARHPRRVVLLSYDRLRSSPAGEVAALFARLGLEVDAQVAGFLADSTSRQDADAYSVFRSERTAIALPADIVAEIGADLEAGALLAQAEALHLR